jgi:hypothetical protein
VRTTIVGGRPPGSGQSVGPIPRGIEVLVKKASVDPDFKGLLLERRAAAAETIGLALDAAEVMMLAAVPAAQLEAIVARTSVPQEHRRTFLGHAAAAMLAAIGFATVGCGTEGPPVTDGIRPDQPPVTDGIRPDPPPELERPTRVEPTKGDRIDVPRVTKGSRPDPVPPAKDRRPEEPPVAGGARPDVPPTR